jgi:hypothetical protein
VHKFRRGHCADFGIECYGLYNVYPTRNDTLISFSRSEQQTAIGIWVDQYVRMGVKGNDNRELSTTVRIVGHSPQKCLVTDMHPIEYPHRQRTRLGDCFV